MQSRTATVTAHWRAPPRRLKKVRDIVQNARAAQEEEDGAAAAAAAQSDDVPNILSEFNDKDDIVVGVM